jgi:cytochrome P450
VTDDDPFEAFNRAMGADGDASPYPDFIDARRRNPVAAEGEPGDGPGFFTAYSYEAVHTILSDGERFSSAGYAEVMGQVFGHSILEMDEPEHHHYRSLIQQAFTRKAMERWEDELVTPLVNRMIDSFIEKGQGDLVSPLLFPFPVNVIAELMGLPAEDLPMFHRLAVELIGVTVDWDKAVSASAKLAEYFGTLVEDRRLSDSPDLISVLARAEQDGERLTDEEIFAFLRLMLPAGAETTYRSSSNLLFGLLSDPAQYEAVHSDRALLPQAIEEGIRWEPPLLIIMRSATVDTEVCGTPIPKESSIICNIGAANHDDTRWADAERFDIHRARKPHIGFASGPHMCLGLHLARMETTVALNAVMDRLPNLRLDPDAPDQFIAGMMFRSPPRLDVLWD